MNEFIDIAPFDIKSCLVAVLCGFLIGLEREWYKKPAGIRTSILVCIGAYTFITIAKFLQPDDSAARVLGQIVTGVGFLGAGLIISEQGSIKGITSAATIWILAAIGSLAGFGYLGGAILITLLTLFVLQIMTIVEIRLTKIRDEVDIKKNNRKRKKAVNKEKIE